MGSVCYFVCEFQAALLIQVILPLMASGFEVYFLIPLKKYIFEFCKKQQKSSSQNQFY